MLSTVSLVALAKIGSFTPSVGVPEVEEENEQESPLTPGSTGVESWHEEAENAGEDGEMASSAAVEGCVAVMGA